MLTGHFANSPIRGQSSRGLVNSWTSQLMDSEVFFEVTERLNYICAKNQNLTIILTLSTVENVPINYIDGDYLLLVLNQTFRRVDQSAT